MVSKFLFWQLDGSWRHSSFTICFNTALRFAFIIINMSFLIDKHRKALRKMEESSWFLPCNLGSKFRLA